MTFKRKVARRGLAAASIAIAANVAPANAAVIYSGIINTSTQNDPSTPFPLLLLDIDDAVSIFYSDPSQNVRINHKASQIIIGGSASSISGFRTLTTYDSGDLIDGSTADYQTGNHYLFSNDPLLDAAFEYGQGGFYSFALTSGSVDRYGWLRVDSNAFSAWIVDWAFEDSGGAILAGDTGGAPLISGTVGSSVSTSASTLPGATAVPLPGALPLGLAAYSLLGFLRFHFSSKNSASKGTRKAG